MKKIYFALLIISILFSGYFTVVTANTQPAPYYPTCQFSGTVDYAININGQNTNTWIGSEEDSLVIDVTSASAIPDARFPASINCNSYKKIQGYIDGITKYPAIGLRDGTKIAGLVVTGNFAIWDKPSAKNKSPFLLTHLRFYESIEDAVRASGGIYGDIDTSDPNAVNNFVDAIFDQGLTNSDGSGNCKAMTIRTGVTISCALEPGDRMASYAYGGRKGEQINMIFASKDFDAEIYVIDANGKFILSEKNYDAHNPLSVKTTLPYTGRYNIQVQEKGGRYGAYTFNIDSDTSGVQTDIRKDNLVAGKKYAVKELNSNQSTLSRKFIVDAYVKYIYKAPDCPPEDLCKMSLPPFITISDDKNSKIDRSNMDKRDAILYLGNYQYDYKVGGQYQFEVSVVNTSNTNIPQNEFTLVSVKKLDESGDVVVLVSQDPAPVKRSFLGRFFGWFTGWLKR